jgi:hypothetical protein
MDNLRDDAQLIISELATNAFRYDGATMTVDALCDERGLVIGVEDGDETVAVLELQGLVDGEAEGGRGLAIVAAVATSWGVRVTPLGKQVWARLVSSELPTATPLVDRPSSDRCRGTVARAPQPASF